MNGTFSIVSIGLTHPFRISICGRILAGTLLEIGVGKRNADDVERLFQSQSRAEAGFTAPAQGLCLMNVEY